ncbi:MAG TPA: STAS domain-containing protein [Candidatus Angelobacter sp.]
MTMKINSRRKNGIVVVDLSGRLVHGEGTALFREYVRDLISKGEKMILLNLQAVPYIDSSGLGELVSTFTAIRKQGGELKLLNLAKHVHGLLQIAKLYTVFEVHDDEVSALQSFDEKRATVAG